MTIGSFSLGGSEHERVEVRVISYVCAPGENDENWLNVQVLLAVGGFTGSFLASFRAEEIVSFREQLGRLHHTLTGEARFVSLENQLFLSLIGNGRGGMSLKGEAEDRVGLGNRLDFKLELDQTQIGATIGELDALIDQFPVSAG